MKVNEPFGNDELGVNVTWYSEHNHIRSAFICVKKFIFYYVRDDKLRKI